MTGMVAHPSLCAVAFADFTSHAAWALPNSYDGTWLEEGRVCANAFVANGETVFFKRPANAFPSTFVIRGRKLSTPLATCRIVRITTTGEQQVLDLGCTTSIATNIARAVFAWAQDGALYRFGPPEGGHGGRYRLCTRGTLNAP